MASVPEGKCLALRKGGVYCCVVGCHNNRYEHGPSGVKFYGFPSDKRAELWRKAINRVNPDGSEWFPGSGAKVCSVHFAGGSKSNIRDHPAYVPTNFPTRHRTERTELDVERHRRLMARQQKAREIQDSKTDTQDDLPFMIDATVQTRPIQLDEDKIHLTEWVCNEAKLSSNSRMVEKSTQVSSQLIERKTVAIQSEKASTSSVGANTEAIDTQSLEWQNRLSDSEFKSSTGVTKNVFQFLRCRLGKELKDSRGLKAEDKLQLALVKIRTNDSFRMIASLFGISDKFASQTFFATLDLLYVAVKPLIFWLDRGTIKSRMPKSFRNTYPGTTAIIDCSEIECEVPNGVKEQVLLYSQYKARHTIKFLIAIAPSGEIMFISQAFGGRSTDTEVTCQSGFLDLVRPGDEILADKGFPKIETDINKSGGILIMPPFKRGQRQFNSQENLDGYKIASVRIHVERCIQRMKVFKTLHFIHSHMLSSMDKILTVVAFLCNCKSDLIKEDA